MSLFEKGKKGLSSSGIKRYESSSTAAFYKKLEKKIREVEALMSEAKKNRFSKKKGGKVK